MSVGTSLGPYEIRSALGAGGMGEVYRAQDKRLRRDVALKLLPAALLGDATNRRRFADEAQAASALNHPNIVSIFDVRLDGDPPYIVSELVDGVTLKVAAGGRPMPVRKTLEIAVQIVDGMAAAHDAGIVHRDLKPQNIMIRPDGLVKILDFGLAKQLPQGASSSSHDEDTLAMSLTDDGKMVGTVHYMSPEQACGKQADPRSDLFSFGIILYEMVSGKHPFDRPSRVETLSAILRDHPDPLPATIPVHLRWTIDRCLAKEPRERYQSTRDLYADLRKQRDYYGDSSASSKDLPVVVQSERPRVRRWLPAAWLGGGLLAGLLLMALLITPGAPGLRSDQLRPLATGPDTESNPAWSPNGLSIAYDSPVDRRAQIFARSLDSPAALQVTHCPQSCSFPAWSADSSRLYFAMGRSVMSVSAAGGEPQTVVDGAIHFALSRDGTTLAYVQRDTKPLAFHVSVSSPPGAPPVRYTPGPFEGTDFNGARVAFSPDGKQLLLWISLMSLGRHSEYWLLPLPAGSGKPRRVLERLGESFPVRGMSWMPDNRRVVLASATPPDLYRSHLYIASIDGSRIDPLTPSIGSEEFPDVSPDGKRLAFTAAARDFDVVEIPLDGSPVRPLIQTSRIEYSPAWSSRAREFAYVTDRRGENEIWVKTLERGWDKPVVTQRSLAAGAPTILDSPAFSPDGERIAFVGGHTIWIAPVAGGAPVRLSSADATQQYAPTWSPDGNWIAYFSQGRQFNLMKAPVGGRGDAVALMDTPSIAPQCVPDWSPRGDWIAYYSAGSTVLVSPDGKSVRKVHEPAFAGTGWSRDGTTLYGLSREDGGKQTLYAVTVDTGAEKRLFDIDPSSRIGTAWAPALHFSLSPDGKALATTLRRESGDIWILENFDRPSGLLARLGLRRPAANR